MAKNLIRSLGLLTAVALVPVATASLAAPDVDASTYQELEAFMRVFNEVRGAYVEEVDDKTLIRGAIDGMLSSLDPHSGYLDERDFDRLITSTDGEYGGLGLTVGMEDGAVKVVAATEDTPADKAGIKPGDFLTHLNGKLIYGGTLDEAVDQMRGPPGTDITVTVFRPGREKPMELKMTRAMIELKAVKWDVKDNVGIINVNAFNRTTTPLTVQAMADIEKKLGHAPLGYILDLRSNPGGLVDEAVGLSDVFLESGEVVSSRGRKASDTEHYYAKPGDLAKGRPVIVLIDAGSASASEIVAGALQDHKRAIIMGERSFGKGSVQTLLPLSRTTGLRLTTARYYTPKGRSVQEGGITPDLPVPQLSDPDYKNRPRIREADLRRHLINELKVEDDVIQDDGKPDPRFSATAEELEKKGIEDFQLHYALSTISRLGSFQQAAAPAAKKAGAR
ncbi:S41 family peptidase [Allosphingosinicella flava]|uniref:S41 family peptidase n=1 Tax=Allosphingosinicella flava TaxID=2771430 RepID=A0A7T2GHX2_9SPHN|nr:S41 family peptidase [Sphingosinicella flava]QPQ54195.1 S41 family peptidase [Sphingosinicella flava]